MLIAGEPRRLGVPSSEARLRFEEGPRRAGAGAGLRLLALDGEPAFERSFWCGTCGLLFRRLEGAQGTLSPEGVRDRLAGHLTDVDDGVLQAFGSLLPEGDYRPLLLRIEPSLVFPGKEGDYFSGEKVATWGIDGFWGLPDHPCTPYFRTFETPVDNEAHFYEFVVPMVPPSWNERERVADYAERLGGGAVPTAVAVSTLDRCMPAMNTGATDYYEHWGLTHFLLDGHHKMEAAASTGRPLQLLSLLAIGEGLSEDDDHRRLLGLRTQQRQERGAR
ncbi:hypothetical protein [Streptomyces sp. NPDC008317]|uniref:hypothetical protein n=1 Tax=Streptomyces sp. NPDC008317 TaxID=3364827 RepID=UPI0036E2D5C3